jgi:hypothetical protein
MRLFYDKWRIPIDSSFQESEEHGARVFRKAGKEVYVRHVSHGLPKAEGIQLVKAQANPRHVKLFETDWDLCYRWACKHVEEIETPLGNRYSIEAHYVIEGEALVVVAVVANQREDTWWADELVKNWVEFDREWNDKGLAYVYTLHNYAFGSYSRSEDGEWFGNRFVGSLPTDAAAADLGKLVRQALGRTRRDVPTRNRSRHAGSPSRDAAFFRAARVSDVRALYTYGHRLYVRAQDMIITMVPCCNCIGYDRQSYDGYYAPQESSAVQITAACSDEELGQALQTTMGRCFFWWEEQTATSK